MCSRFPAAGLHGANQAVQKSEVSKVMSGAGRQERAETADRAQGVIQRRGVARRGRPAAAVLVAAAVLGGAVMLFPVSRAAALNLNGSQGYLGVDIRDVGDDQMGPLKLKEARGAEVMRVDHDGPAGKMGLQVHDVILQMNGETIVGQEQLRRMLHETPPGRAVTLVVSREGQQQTMQTQLANREEVERRAWEEHLTVPEPSRGGEVAGADPAVPAPGPGERGGTAAPGSMGFLHGGLTGRSHGLLSLGSPYTGVMVEPVGAQLAQFFGVAAGTGLLVKNVESNSPAATAGLQAGDVVLKANQMTLASAGDWTRVMHESKGKAVSLTVVREKKEQTLSLTPDPKRRSAMDWPFDPGFADIAPVDTGALVAQLRPLTGSDLSAQLDAMEAGRDAFREDDLRKAFDEAKRNMPDAAAMQRLTEDAMRQMPSQAELQKFLEDARRAAPDATELRHMVDDANTQLNNGDSQRELKQLQQQVGPGSDFQNQMHDLREQMMRSMPGSMD